MVHLDDGNLLCEVLELPNVASPVGLLQESCRLIAERERRHMIPRAEIDGELPEEERDVLFPFAQGGYAYLYGVEAVEEVFAEASVVGSLPHVEVGGSDDTYVGLAHLSGAHAQELSRLQHAQQPHLRLQGQFAHFVQEQGAPVGYLEIAFVLVLGVREGTFLVSEELGVNGALRYGTAVDREIRSVLARRESMDNLREMLLPDARLAGDEDTEVRPCDLHCHFDISVEQRTVADNAETLLDG